MFQGQLCHCVVVANAPFVLSLGVVLPDSAGPVHRLLDCGLPQLGTFLVLFDFCEDTAHGLNNSAVFILPLSCLSSLYPSEFLFHVSWILIGCLIYFMFYNTGMYNLGLLAVWGLQVNAEFFSYTHFLGGSLLESQISPRNYWPGPVLQLLPCDSVDI